MEMDVKPEVRMYTDDVSTVIHRPDCFGVLGRFCLCKETRRISFGEIFVVFERKLMARLYSDFLILLDGSFCVVSMSERSSEEMR
jgi:hypothetical protein